MSKKTAGGYYRTPTHNTWRSILSRCYDPSQDSFKYYGGRSDGAIEVCERWVGESGFLHFLADMGERPDGHTIDRIDVNGPYSPENCRWSDAKTQSRNRRCITKIEFNGVSLTLPEWSLKIDVPYYTLYARIRNPAWTLEQALTTPLKRAA
jgi:hypothetical protein